MFVAGYCPGKKQSLFFQKLRSAAAIGCVLVGTAPSFAQAPQQTVPAVPGLPPEPAPNYTQPLYLRDTPRDFTKARGYWPNLVAPYLPASVPAPSFLNSLQLHDLVTNGKIYLSLGDAVLLALQNNYDIAIQRLNLDIADTDLLRARSGNSLLGVNAGTVANTIGGGTTATQAGGGPGGTSTAAGGAGAGFGGVQRTTNGGGTVPVILDPALTGTVEMNHQVIPENTPFTGPLTAINQNTDTYNFAYNQAFITGTAMQVSFQNTRQTTNNPFVFFSPTLQSTFTFSLTQHLLQGFGWGVNGRFIVQAKNDRRIADSAFRAQLLYTINQVEDIYWGLVGAYEDVQAKERALAQSSRLVQDNEKQLQIGSMAPLDVVNARSGMASDQQALIAAQNKLEYQQLVMKQAISRNLDDPGLANAPVIPTDRVSLVETPEEDTPVDELVRQADANSPAVEQAVLNLKNDQITLKGEKNGLLPVLDVEAFYGAAALGGAVSPNCSDQLLIAFGDTGGCKSLTPANYGTVFGNLFNSSAPNKGVVFNLNVPLRNRRAQSEEARSQIEYRQAQMQLQQLYVQIRMNVINYQYALTNDRAAVRAAQANRDYNRQSLEAEEKKLHLGASTTANVLQQEKNLAAAENSVISATTQYAMDRAALRQVLATTLDRYGISIVDAATGQIHTAPVIPGLESARPGPEVIPPTQQQLHQQQQQQQQERNPAQQQNQLQGQPQP